MMRKIRKGDRVEYTGPYAPSVPEEAKYGPGEVVGFKDYGEFVVVRLDDAFFAHWPVAETRRIG